MKAEEIKKLAKEIGETVIKKNQCYGDSFSKTGDILRVLYPNGIKPEQYDDMLAIARLEDKICRLAESSDHDDESPGFDISGYGMLIELMKRSKQVAEQT
jgi:hypothetical protein